MKKLDLLSVMTSTELNVIRGGDGKLDPDGGTSLCSTCDCCGTCDSISMSGTAASKFAGLYAVEKQANKRI